MKALRGRRRGCVETLRDTIRAAVAFEETIKWSHLVYIPNGPVLLIRAEEERALFGFWRGKRLVAIEPRLKPSGKHEMATLALRKGMTIDADTVRDLATKAASLNKTLGELTKL